ncbi:MULTISPECIES: EAL domain-containing protein [unclassified Pseudoalteromonas]|uniref:EAL domain-containing protein n=1 Tax=unclassified Pseudoalteromonas TaxID=194690 RepID=UPI00301441B3
MYFMLAAALTLEGAALLITPWSSAFAGATVMAACALALQRPSVVLLLAHVSSMTLAVLLLFTGQATWLYLLTLPLLLYLMDGLQQSRVGFLVTTTLAIIALVGWLIYHYLFFIGLHYAATIILMMYCVRLCYSAIIAAAPKSKEAANSHPEDDSLGLPGRQALKQAFLHYRSQHPFTCMLVLVRLVGFEKVNFHLGREFGDLLLAQSANRISQCLQINEVMAITHHNESAKLAHLGGLNFVFICSLEHANHLHEQLLEQIADSTLQPFNVGSCTVEVSMRASYVNCDEEMGQLENLISCAFMALDSQPQQQVVPYQQRMQIKRLEQQVRLSELAKIDFRNEFELYFHPVIRHQDNQVEFVELLLRWQHPKQGILNANEFIDDIRLAGLAEGLAEYVLERACELALALKMEKVSVPISINVLGPELLSEHFIDYLDHTILNHQLSPDAIIIECPASMLASLSDSEVAMLRRLKGMGIRMCIDGFGEAPLILAKLPAMKFDYVKLSRSMTNEPEKLGHTKALVKGIVEMHQQKHCMVIGEGVETQSQLDFVKSLGTIAAQGFYFIRPQNSNILISWVKQWRLSHPS